jgi:hypothetical protein
VGAVPQGGIFEAAPLFQRRTTRRHARVAWIFPSVSLQSENCLSNRKITHKNRPFADAGVVTFILQERTVIYDFLPLKQKIGAVRQPVFH